MEAVFRRRAQEAGWPGVIDSAGTTSWHEGEPPDPRTIAVGEAAGYALAGLRARQVVADDFVRFGLILAADRTHFTWLRERAPAEHRDKIRFFLPNDADLPDPYYGNERDFLEVLRLVEHQGARWQGEIKGA